jgi:hypothetical protein
MPRLFEGDFMIKLCDVSTERLITFLKYDLYKQGEVLNAYLALTKHSIKDYQTLKDMIQNGRREFKNEFLKNAVSEVEKNIEYANQLGKEPVLFTCDNYKDANVDQKTLKVTDRKNSCGVLLYKSPAIVSRGKSGALDHIQISEAKSLLGKVTGHSKSCTGNNAFVEAMNRFGELDSSKIRDAINFYEKQVLRQAEETKKRGVNLFIVNQREKQFIVREEIKSIVKYLVDNADVCVWGELSSAQKTRLMSAVTRYSGYENQLLRERMIQIITNYTTLSELQTGVVKQKTLDRFIVK